MGLLLDDRYRVEELIARGGMATVHRGHDQRLDRVVALKIMHPHLATDEDFRRRFGREARSAARLAHRNVVGVFDQGEDADSVYLAMELIEGRTLRARISEQPRQSLREVLDVTAQVLEALVAAHRAGIVHRDIKPENILIDHSGVVKVADFGLARAIGTSNSSASATLLGTVAYISPEVVTRGHSDERSDLYSLGVVLFEMLTGTQPFTGEQPVHVAFQHVHDDIPAPSTVVSGIPRELDSLVTWAAARSVEQRPAGALDLLRAVHELQHSLPDAVMDTRPRPREDADTGEVPRPTVLLEEVIADLGAAPRAFPLPGPAENTDEDTAGDEEPASRSVIVPAPRPRQGRHRVQGARRRSPMMAGLATLSAVAVLALGGWGGADWYLTVGPGADRTVPVLVGTRLSDAEAALSAADLGTRTEERFDASVPAGHVISSSPASGESVKRGADVRVVVSRGEETFEVPDLEGMSVEDARSRVEEQGLVLIEDEAVWSETVPAGEIVSQSQEAEALPAGGEVHVVASQGRQPIPIPDQSGREGEAARVALEEAGFTVTTSSAHSASVPEGSVISQSPGSGTGHRGDTVELVTSLGPEMVTVPDVFRMPEDEARSELESAGFSVTVEHDRGEPVFGLVYEQSAEAGSELAKGSTVTLTVF